jgi:hypothetical protein
MKIQLKYISLFLLLTLCFSATYKMYELKNPIEHWQFDGGLMNFNKGDRVFETNNGYYIYTTKKNYPELKNINGKLITLELNNLGYFELNDKRVVNNISFIKEITLSDDIKFTRDNLHITKLLPLDVDLIKDEFDDYVIYRMKNNLLYSDNMASSEVHFLLQKYSKESNNLYNVIIHFIDNKWLFIASGNSLDIMADGQEISLQTEGSIRHRNVLSGGIVTEKAWYEITPEQLKLIANSKIIKIKLTGSELYLVREFNDINISEIKKFISEYVKE